MKLIRKRDRFYTEDGKLFEKFESITQAKRQSRLWQQSGMHTVSVDRSDDPKPVPKRARGDAADRFIAAALREQQAARIAQERERKLGAVTPSGHPRDGSRTLTLPPEAEQRATVARAFGRKP